LAAWAAVPVIAVGAISGSSGIASAASKTWNETPGSSANTWSNYKVAGGVPGPTLPARKTIKVSCKIKGFKVTDGNTWWYRLADHSGKTTFYVSADAFYNNGHTSGSLHGTPFVDKAVPTC
jgi:hypothetical protein